jgi:hypothetical protein
MQLFGVWQRFACAVGVEQKAREAMANLGGTRVDREGAAQNIHGFAGAAGLHALIRARQQRADVACGKPRFRFRPVAPLSHVPAMFVAPKNRLVAFGESVAMLRFHEKGRKQFFFEKKNQKTFVPLVAGMMPLTYQQIKVFWFFFSKKNCCLGTCLSRVTAMRLFTT